MNAVCVSEGHKFDDKIYKWGSLDASHARSARICSVFTLHSPFLHMLPFSFSTLLLCPIYEHTLMQAPNGTQSRPKYTVASTTVRRLPILPRCSAARCPHHEYLIFQHIQLQHQPLLSHCRPKDRPSLQYWMRHARRRAQCPMPAGA